MTIVPLDLNHEWGCNVIGELCSSENIDELSQDMIEVHLPSGLSIEAGWVPENDPSGDYEVLLCRGLHVVHEVKKKTAMEAKFVIEGLAGSYYGNVLQTDDSEHRSCPVPNSANYESLEIVA